MLKARPPTSSPRPSARSWLSVVWRRIWRSRWSPSWRWCLVAVAVGTPSTWYASASSPIWRSVRFPTWTAGDAWWQWRRHLVNKREQRRCKKWYRFRLQSQWTRGPTWVGRWSLVCLLLFLFQLNIWCCKEASERRIIHTRFNNWKGILSVGMSTWCSKIKKEARICQGWSLSRIKNQGFVQIDSL